MKFRILVKANAESEAGVMPDDEMITKMVDYHQELAGEGVERFPAMGLPAQA